MSLFKIRDFWSFDLDQLNRHSADARATPPKDQHAALSLGEHDCKAQFVVSIGRFSAIGAQDVFVCGELKGFIYIIQVPECDQRKYIKRSAKSAQESSVTAASSVGSTASESSSSISERQLLAVTNLGLSVVDLKCGYFTSALKQSIAALSFDKLVILQVKRHQVDLLSGPNKSSNRCGSIDENLLSHEFEEYIKLDLLTGEFAYGLLVLNSHAGSSLVDPSSPHFKETDLDNNNNNNGNPELGSSTFSATSKFQRASKKSVQQLHLPQRDRIIVQYTNQLVFSLIDSKKVSGHFRITNLDGTARNPPAARGGVQQGDAAQTRSDAKLKSMPEFAGSMPMAHFLTNNKASSLVALSFTDHRVHCLSLHKLMGCARQNVMKRVALNLLSANKPPSSRSLIDSTSIGIPQQQACGLIELDLLALGEWSHELISLPLQMQGLQRQAKIVSMQSSDSHLSIGQLLVMSRYSLDLFASSGEHLWHQRSETPLICFSAFTLDGSTMTETSMDHETSTSIPPPATILVDKQKLQFKDQIISMLCSDGIHEDKSNLMIMKDDQSSWSALLIARPSQVWRMNLSLMPGLVAMLDLRHSKLVTGYLGTNLDGTSDPEVETTDAFESTLQSNQLVELERLNEPLFHHDGTATSIDSKEEQRQSLIVTNLLETGAQDGSVNVCTSIQLAPNSTSVVHNIILTYEFDDLIRFNLQHCRDVHPQISALTPQRVQHLTRGVVEVHLGNCWPDRRDPLRVESSFSLMPSSQSSGKQFGTTAMDSLNVCDDNDQDDASEFYLRARMMPKSMLVRQYVTFNETHSGLLLQEHAFLLPLSLIAQLTHVDYSSGHGQNLEDVLNNLSGYKRASETYYCQCDLFLQLSGSDFISLLDEIVEGDLICRGTRCLSSNNQSMFSYSKQEGGGNDREVFDSRLNSTLESINLLAQSLNCRIRYMSPSPSSGMAARQSSEDPAQPVIVTFAISLKNNFLPSFVNGQPSDKFDWGDEQIVWIHICDMSPSFGSKIVENFVTAHMKDWKQYPSDGDVDPTNVSFEGEELSTGDRSRSRVFISIESHEVIPGLFVLEHLLDRVVSLTQAPRLSIELIETNTFGASRNFQDHTSRRGNMMAISNKLHDKLVSIVSVYESEHKAKYRQLQEELAKEYCKFQLVTATSLSLAKRLPSLPDHMSGQLESLMSLAKQYQLRLMAILDELDSMRRCDYEYSKLPDIDLIKIDQANNKGAPVKFSRVID